MLLDLVPAGHIASVVTSLEMRARPRTKQMPFAPLRLVRWPRPSLSAYRGLFRRIGEPWLWHSRLQMDEQALVSKIYASTTDIYAVTDVRGIEIGLLELNFEQPEVCEIALLGFVPEWTGKGNGRWLMAQALNLAWRPEITRVWTHSCTMDHPIALSFYLSCGFKAFARAMEAVPDPRLNGTLSRNAAPHIPIISATD